MTGHQGQTRHYPMCWTCGGHFSHHFMKEVIVKGQKRHYCIPCDEEYQRRKSEEMNRIEGKKATD